MKLSDKQIERMAKMTFASIYPLYLKSRKKGRTEKRASSSYRLAL